MNGERTRRIIAVFGGSTGKAVLRFAYELGQAIADADQILLTGGTGPRAEDSDTVKNRAIEGAGSSPWVGVERKRTGQPECDDEEIHGLVMTLNLGHKRNYLEALMCDAAIALAGGTGTTSEVVSALSLRRPVALVGDDWKSTWRELGSPAAPAAGRDDELTRLWTTSKQRLCDQRAENHALDAGIDGIPLALTGDLRYAWFEEGVRTAEIVSWITDAVPGTADLRGGFPEEVDPRVADKYHHWLCRHGTNG